METFAIWEPSPPLPLIILYFSLTSFFGFRNKIKPEELTFTMFLVIQKIPNKEVTIRVYLDP